MDFRIQRILHTYLKIKSKNQHNKADSSRFRSLNVFKMRDRRRVCCYSYPACDSQALQKYTHYQFVHYRMYLLLICLHLLFLVQIHGPVSTETFCAYAYGVKKIPGFCRNVWPLFWNQLYRQHVDEHGFEREKHWLGKRMCRQVL